MDGYPTPPWLRLCGALASLTRFDAVRYFTWSGANRRNSERSPPAGPVNVLQDLRRLR